MTLQQLWERQDRNNWPLAVVLAVIGGIAFARFELSYWHLLSYLAVCNVILVWRTMRRRR